MPLAGPQSSPLLRYAVLHHTGVPSPHFDLLIEGTPGADLATWRSPGWPVHRPTPVERLDDHRRIYLDYEGPISGSRGTVRRVAGGTCSVKVEPGNVWIIVIAAGPIHSLVIRPTSDGAWELEAK